MPLKPTKPLKCTSTEFLLPKSLQKTPGTKLTSSRKTGPMITAQLRPMFMAGFESYHLLTTRHTLGYWLGGRPSAAVPPESARKRADSAGRPPKIFFGGVRRKIFLADVRRIRAEPGGVRAYPRGFARIRGGSSSAEPVATH